MSTTETERRCIVCQETLDEQNLARCFMCSGYFHYPQQEEADLPECGQGIAHRESIGLLFICANCYDVMPEEEAY